MLAPYAEIHFPLPLSRGYTYRVPANLNAVALPGCRALVPLGKRVMTGFIVKRVSTIDFSPDKLKDVFDILDEQPLFDEQRLQLALWISEYYLASLGEVLRTMLPPGLEQESKQFVRLVREPEEFELGRLLARAPRQFEIVQALQGKKGFKIAFLAKHLGYQGVRESVRGLMKAGLVEILQEISASARALAVTYVQLHASGRKALAERESTGLKLNAKQWESLELLRSKGALSRPFLLRKVGLSRPGLDALVKKSLVELTKQEVERNPYAGRFELAPNFILNEEQSAAVAAVSSSLNQNAFKVFLLHGITGSGKTQVYIEAIRHALALGKGAIALVPEISLTPQTVARFQSNFGLNIAVLHSRLSHGERYDAWRRVQRGEAKLVIGPRSAVFAPVHNLGLIVVDEEHEASYKQVDPSPRYHARDVAIMRAKMSNAAVLLGSATPAVESYYNARAGKYHLLELPRRIDNVPLPEVRLLDMMRFRKSAPDHEGIFSRILLGKILEKLERKEQIIILQNRRGFAPIVKCVDCGFTKLCEACNIPLTYHRRGHALRCHYCNHFEKAPDVCPQCHSLELIYKGIGTQKVEDALHELLPQARVVRMDSDTTRGKLAHDNILREFGEHKFDVLLGTQMIAKGLDFHRVTLVGVISADSSLLRPDFRAGERTFQLLTQVAGRAGRSNLPGEVIIQTYSPMNFCLICAQQHDFHKFFAAEIEQRRQLNYPPFARLAVVLFRHKDNEKVRGVAHDFAGLVRAAKAPLQVYGPTPAPLQRLQNEFRWQLMIKSDPLQDPSARRMRETLASVLRFVHKAQARSRMRITIDIDPAAIF